MYNPKVSLIMPMYNHEKYIEQSLSSLVNQTYKNFELIVIDDGSDDNSAHLVKSFNDKRIKYIYQKNRGVKNLNRTINKGLKLATGELITMVTSDDFWPLNRLKNQINYFKNQDIDLVFGNMSIINVIGDVIKYFKPNLPNKFNDLDKNTKIKHYFLNNYIPQPTTLIRTKALKKIGGYIQKKYMYAEDYPTQMNLIINGNIYYINKNFSFYRLHDNQMTNLHTEKMIISDNRYLIEFYKKLPNNKKKLTGFKNISELKLYLKKKFESKFLYIGFKKACLGNYVIARKYFFKSISTGKLNTKFQSLILLLLTFINFDFNLLKKLRRNYFLK